MDKTILVVLIGSTDAGQKDRYQLLQEDAARAEGVRGQVAVEIVAAPGFDHLRVIRKRLLDRDAPPLDAVVVEPGSVSSTGLILRELKGKIGLVLLNAWSPDVEEQAKGWGEGLPFGTVSTDHVRIGRIQGQQILALLPSGGQVLCVTGPQRSSAALERLEGTKLVLGSKVELYETEAGHWLESDGIVAFDAWYALRRTRDFVLHVVAAQSDELAVGALRACEAVNKPGHRQMLLRARFLGVDACPGFGRELVDSGRLAASVTTPPNTGEAIGSLRRFWESGRPLPMKVLTEPSPYPLSSAPLP
jgi:ABC-type sugar transport system substrate-binding protein